MYNIFFRTVDVQESKRFTIFFHDIHVRRKPRLVVQQHEDRKDHTITHDKNIKTLLMFLIHERTRRIQNRHLEVHNDNTTGLSTIIMLLPLYKF